MSKTGYLSYVIFGLTFEPFSLAISYSCDHWMLIFCKLKLTSLTFYFNLCKMLLRTSLSVGKRMLAMQGDLGSVPGSRTSTEKESNDPLKYSCLLLLLHKCFGIVTTLTDLYERQPPSPIPKILWQSFTDWFAILSKYESRKVKESEVSSVGKYSDSSATPAGLRPWALVRGIFRQNMLWVGCQSTFSDSCLRIHVLA